MNTTATRNARRDRWFQEEEKARLKMRSISSEASELEIIETAADYLLAQREGGAGHAGASGSFRSRCRAIAGHAQRTFCEY